jgi:hypothetical protein
MGTHRSDGAHHCRHAITVPEASRRALDVAVDWALLPDVLPLSAGEVCTGGVSSGGGAIANEVRDDEGTES